VLRRKRKRSKKTKKKWLYARECTIDRRVHIMQKHREMEAIVVFVEGDDVTLRVSNGELLLSPLGQRSRASRRSPTVARLTPPPRVEVMKSGFSAATNVMDNEKSRNKAFFVTREKEAIAERAKVWYLVKSGLQKEGPTSTEKPWSSLFVSELREHHVISSLARGHRASRTT